jgi:hypothetical protein
MTLADGELQVGPVGFLCVAFPSAIRWLITLSDTWYILGFCSGESIFSSISN